MSGVKIGLRSKLLIAAFGLLTVAGCVPVGYYDQPAYGYNTGVVVQYDSYGGRPYHGRPYYGPHYGRHYWR